MLGPSAGRRPSASPRVAQPGLGNTLRPPRPGMQPRAARPVAWPLCKRALRAYVTLGTENLPAPDPKTMATELIQALPIG